MAFRSTDQASGDPGTSSRYGPEAASQVQQETVVTNGPTQSTTERRTTGAGARAPVSLATSRTVVRDIGEERRYAVSRVTQVIWFVVGLIETLLALRLVLTLTGASVEAGFTQLILGVTQPLVTLFLGIFPSSTRPDSFVFDSASAVAMLVYFLIGLGLAQLVSIVYGKTSETA